MLYGFAMGLKDLLFGGPEGKLKRQVARAKNQNAQSPERMAAIQFLRDEGSPAAVLGMLGRFNMRADKLIEDEQEKEWVYDELCKMGAKILPQLQEHMRSSEGIAYGLKLLGAIADKEQQWPVLADLCERNDNSYTRDPSKKVQLLNYLGELDDARAPQALVPYLEDVDETVRFTAVEGLLHHKVAEVGRDPMLALLVSEKEESRRIKKRILDGFADLGWDVKGQSGTVEKMLSDLLPGARLDNHSKIKRKQT